MLLTLKYCILPLFYFHVRWFGVLVSLSLSCRYSVFNLSVRPGLWLHLRFYLYQSLCRCCLHRHQWVGSYYFSYWNWGFSYWLLWNLISLIIQLPFIVTYSSTCHSGKLDITPDDPRWIGAWWGGFLLCGALLFLSALFMFGFPQALDEQDMDGGAESEQSMLPSSLTLDFQDNKSNGAIHSLDINSGLSVCEHLRGKGQ